MAGNPGIPMSSTGGTLAWATNQTLKDFKIPLPSGTPVNANGSPKNPNAPVDDFKANSELMGSVVMMSNDALTGPSQLLSNVSGSQGTLLPGKLVSLPLLQSAENNYHLEANNAPSGSAVQQQALLEAHDLQSGLNTLNNYISQSQFPGALLPSGTGFLLNNLGQGKSPIQYQITWEG